MLIILINFLETLKDLKSILELEIRPINEMAKDLNDIGVLPKLSYLAVTSSFNTIAARSYPFINLLFNELVDPTTFDNFKDFCRRKLPQSYEVLTSMGEY